MPQTVRFLSPADLHDIVRGMAVVARLYDKDPDVRFRLDQHTRAAVGVWHDFVGNACHLLFTPDGSAILGFDHESPMYNPDLDAGPGEAQAFAGIYDHVPPALLARIQGDDLAADLFDPADVTFCLWNVGGGRDWQKGDIAYPPRANGDPDGQKHILATLKAYYDDFSGQFEETYNWDIDPDAVADLLSGDRVSLTCIRALKPDANPLEARRWLPEMGFVVDTPAK